MSTVKCPHCGFENLPVVSYCKQCQRPVARSRAPSRDTVITPSPFRDPTPARGSPIRSLPPRARADGPSPSTAAPRVDRPPRSPIPPSSPVRTQSAFTSRLTPKPELLERQPTARGTDPAPNRTPTPPNDDAPTTVAPMADLPRRQGPAPASGAPKPVARVSEPPQRRTGSPLGDDPPKPSVRTELPLRKPPPTPPVGLSQSLPRTLDLPTRAPTTPPGSAAPTVVRPSPPLSRTPEVRATALVEGGEDVPRLWRWAEPEAFAKPSDVPSDVTVIPSARAPLWRLSLAATVDLAVIVTVGGMVAVSEMLLFAGHWPSDTTTGGLDALAMWLHTYSGTARHATLVMMAFALCYATLGAKWGRTLGRGITDLWVLRQSGEPVHWRWALWRGACAVASSLCFGAGYWWMVVDRWHRGWHDLAGGSVVVWRRR